MPSAFFAFVGGGLVSFKKILVANRGEIAIRVFRACSELSIPTVAIYSFEDRFSLHRYKADEAYQVGKEGAPVAAYLEIAPIIEVARSAGVEAIHPGYGFLSERAEFRTACDRAGITFIGPSAETLSLAGDKTKARQLASELSVPIIPGTTALKNSDEAIQFGRTVGFPVMLKAAFGGGGRGMRLAKDEAELKAAFEAAQSEAERAFGRGEIFAEKYVARPKHLEVQLLGDGKGNVIHLFERDCSVQRRHQKVVEFAPALAVDDKVRTQLFEYALTLARKLKLQSAATAEFLLSEQNELYFIEINPRIQVEHTVTEEITGIDIVQSQIQIASGMSLQQLDLSQDKVSTRGVAIQCRITTEDPINNFQPDYGKLLAYRSASGFGVRLDSGSAFTGGEITPFYDSLLVKVTARGRTMEEAAPRLRRALREFRVRGVKTNIAFLEKLISHPNFLDGSARTSFLEEHPDIFELPQRRDRANKLLRFIGETTVNGHDSMGQLERPLHLVLEDVSSANSVWNSLKPGERPAGWRDVFLKGGAKALCEKVRTETKLLVTDTSLRDAHQSLIATRLRTHDMLPIARYVSDNVPQLFSMEMWGGATFDVCLRFLRDDPWERLARLRETVPNILFQMLLRGANVVGYKSYPPNVIREFVKESRAAGIDIFRIFDCFNQLSQMQVALEAVKACGGIAELAICYTGDLELEQERSQQGKSAKYHLKYFAEKAKLFADAGADMIAIKDMSGLLRPHAARKLIAALRDATDLPIHLHTHDAAGSQGAAYLQACDAGVDIVDCAFSAVSGTTSQPSLEGLVAALEHHPRATGLQLASLTPVSEYWEKVRCYYGPFESDLKSATGEVYLYEIPGGQYSNLRPQAAQLGLGDRWTEIKHMYADVNAMLGNIIKVTPSSKVVGDLALYMVAQGLKPRDVIARASELSFPLSVIELLRGDMGFPDGGFPEELRRAVLKESYREEPSSVSVPDADLAAIVSELAAKIGSTPTQFELLSYLMYPQVFLDFHKHREEFGDVSIMPTVSFLYGLREHEEVVVDLEPGKRLYIHLNAIGDADAEGLRRVFFELNGQPRSFKVIDKKLAAPKKKRPKAETPQQIGSPLTGALVAVHVKVGQKVNVGTEIFAIEAMKMQTVVKTPLAGTIAEISEVPGTHVEQGDLIVVLS